MKEPLKCSVDLLIHESFQLAVLTANPFELCNGVEWKGDYEENGVAAHRTIIETSLRALGSIQN
jgi:hypothetical protein